MKVFNLVTLEFKGLELQLTSIPLTLVSYESRYDTFDPYTFICPLYLIGHGDDLLQVEKLYFRFHKKEIYGITQIKNGYVVSVSRDTTIKFWDMNKLICIFQIEIGFNDHVIQLKKNYNF